MALFDSNHVIYNFAIHYCYQPKINKAVNFKNESTSVIIDNLIGNCLNSQKNIGFPIRVESKFVCCADL